MTKVTITMTIDVPGYEDYPKDADAPAYLQQNLFDDVINYNTCSHYHDAVKWCAKSKGDESSTAHMIYEHHNLWGDIMNNCEWNFKVEEKDD